MSGGIPCLRDGVGVLVNYPYLWLCYPFGLRLLENWNNCRVLQEYSWLLFDFELHVSKLHSGSMDYWWRLPQLYSRAWEAYSLGAAHQIPLRAVLSNDS